MMFIWSFASFGSFLIPFYLATLGGNIFLYAIFSAVAEVFASLVCATITRWVSLKKSLLAFSMVSTFSSLLLVFFGNGSGTSVAFLILFANFGIVSTFDICYLINLELFPSIFMATAYGCCNVLGRFISILSPLIAQAPHPIPMIILTVYAALASVLVLFLTKIKGTVPAAHKPMH
jgi:hypothetical protein